MLEGQIIGSRSRIVDLSRQVNVLGASDQTNQILTGLGNINIIPQGTEERKVLKQNMEKQALERAMILVPFQIRSTYTHSRIKHVKNKDISKQRI